MFKNMIQFILAAMIVAAVPAVHASVIDFNSVPNIVLTVGGGALDDEVFSISSTDTAGPGTFSRAGYLRNLGNGGPKAPYNGSNYFTMYSSGLQFTSLSGNPFSLSSFDGAEEANMQAPYLLARSIKVTGEIAGGGSISQIFNLDWINDGIGPLSDFQTFNLAGFDNLQSVTFSGINGDLFDYNFFSIDNLNVSISSPEAPEPASLAIFGLGLASLAFLRRKYA